MDIQRIKLRLNEEKYYPQFVDLYLSAFPLYERRNPDTLPDIFARADYHVDAWVSEDKLLGFLAWWSNDDFSFVEHYAIHPDSRSFGFGSRFLQEWMNEHKETIILEIEPVVDELTGRRLSFYQRLLFSTNEHIRHEQPPYHKGLQAVPLEVLSFPGKITEEQYQHFKERQATVYMPDFTR